MSFVNIGTDGPPNHTLEVEGDMFVSNVEQGTATNYVPLEVKGNLRIRNKPATGIDEYRVTDMQLYYPPLFGITAPSSDVSESITDFCIDSSGNVGIGVIPTEKLDVNGSLYATGSLTGESNIITGTLSSTGTLTCNAIFHGVTSDIYGLLPTGAILMTTLTSTPNGWTDITSQFTDKNVLLAENQSTLATGGNDNFTISSNFSHNHGWANTHTVSHSHNVNQGNMDAAGVHTHTKPTNNLGTNVMENNNNQHNHTVLVRNGTSLRGTNNTSGNRIDGIPGSDFYNVAYITLNINSNHSHGRTTYNFNSSKMNHSHNLPSTSTSSAKGGNHNHTFSESGSSSVNDGDSFSILPSSYGLRFIKKN
jgi:hypothetical protein